MRLQEQQQQNDRTVGIDIAKALIDIGKALKNANEG
jgi:hypothetical protein